MASGSFGVSTSNGYISGVINWSESQQNSSADTSVVYAEMRLSRTNSGYTSSGTDTFYLTINGTQFSNNFHYSITQNSNTLMVSGSVTVTHNADGTKSIPISWSGGGGSGGVFTVNASSGTATLDTLPRASTVSSNVSWTAGTQDLAVNLNVADSSFHHTLEIWIQHTYDGNYDFVGNRTNIGSSTTWQFSQAEITQIYTTNSGYENRPVILRVYTYNSGGSQIGGYQDTYGTVYAIPTATVTLNSNNTFNIGDTIPYTLSNYTTGSTGGFTYDFVFTFGGYSWTISSNTAQSGNLTFSSTVLTNMYQQIPNANSGIGNVRVRTYYNGVSTEDGNPATDQTNFTANVTNSNPTFTGGMTYADTKSAVTTVTGNNQYIVQNQSTVNVTLPSASAATAINAATMSYYTATLANATGTINVPTVAPTLSTATTGGNLAATTYYVKYTYVTAAGESLPSPEKSIVVPTGTSTNTITVTLPSALPTGVTKANIYISTATGTETLQGNTTGTTYTQTATLASGAAMPTSMVFSLGTVNASVNANLQVKAVDSRGNSTTATLSVNIVPYSAPQINATAARNNGFDASTVLTLSGSASAVSVGGTNKNSIVSAQYQTRQKGGTFGSLSNFTVTGFPNYSATNVTLTLDNTLAWDINFVVTDKFGNTAIIQSVAAGTPIMAVDSSLKSVGVGKFPTGTGTFETAGAIVAGGNITAPSITSQGSVTTQNGVNKALEVLANGASIAKTGIDWNTIIDAGFYDVNLGTNAPPQSTSNPDHWFHVMVMKRQDPTDNGKFWVYQFASDFRDGVYHRRAWIDGPTGNQNWDAWRRITDDRRALLFVSGGGQSLAPNTNTRATWNTPTESEGFIWQPGGNSNMFAVQESGWYEISYGIMINQSVNTSLSAQLWGNPSTLSILGYDTTNNGWNWMYATVVATLNPNTNYEIVLQQGDGSYTRTVNSHTLTVKRL